MYFLVCYNEQVLLPHALKHYRHFLPGCKITIYDNFSTDNSVPIAKEHGCSIISYGMKDQIDESALTRVKNESWKNVENGWVIICDMDEWLCITRDDLINEEKKEQHFLKTFGYHMVSDSTKLDLSDIDLHTLQEGVAWRIKPMCFKRPDIKSTGFGHGVFSHNAKGTVKMSDKIYAFKHMGGHMGYEFYKNKTIKRFERVKGKTPAIHYTNNIKKIDTVHAEFCSNKKKIDKFDEFMINLKQ